MNTAELEKVHSEISKLITEAGKLNAETGKLNAETGKLNAENRKFTREVFWYPIAVSSGLIGAVAGITAILIKLL